MEATLDAVRRDRFGRNEAGRLRREGRIPAVLYGGGAVAEPLAVDPRELLHILRSDSGVNTLITLRVPEAAEARVLVKEYQLDPVTHGLLHADFLRIAMDKVLQVRVPVHLSGEPRGVKAQGGLLDFVTRELEVECLPADIPEHIAVDVSELLIHQSVRVRDLPAGAAWKAVSDPDLLIAHVVPPRVEAEPEPVEAAPVAAAEPEVIKKGKAEEEKEKAE